ncbi:SGNH/GDSL hydrolase family protein [Bosea caraganae]|uniref:SGNH/GDSL hydrolase family protein n=1 Tax=Bosea caraganae TaxID=2763117 RepID=A0A370KXX9_9HYPH|nr:SGNH/GDSL hydrolase family protein [Bosea caraganae]RDJ19854.1 SGNH/GDSL hydrolase family protein [Bosea caraganae]RDJ25584.1 SGNH/GDSL hydrolase family protein [Bosea caraganae]
MKNLDRHSLAKFRAAIADTRTGIANTRVLYEGDSITRGVGTVSQWGGEAYSKAVPQRVADRMNSADLKWSRETMMALGGLADGDNRLTTSGATPFGNTIRLEAGNTATHTTVMPCTNFDVWYYASAASSFSYAIDGGVAVVVPFSRTGFHKLSLSYLSNARHAVRFTGISGTIRLVAQHGYSAAVKEVAVFNHGISGATAAMAAAATSPYSVANTISQIQPHLTVINYGLNDWQKNVTPADFKASLRTLIGFCTPTGDVVLETCNPGGGGPYAYPITAYWQAMRELSDEIGCPLIDTGAVWGDYGSAQLKGLMYDTLHPLANGYDEKSTRHVALFRKL